MFPPLLQNPPRSSHRQTGASSHWCHNWFWAIPSLMEIKSQFLLLSGLTLNDKQQFEKQKQTNLICFKCLFEWRWFYLHRAPLLGTWICLLSPSQRWLSCTWVLPCSLQLERSAKSSRNVKAFNVWAFRLQDQMNYMKITKKTPHFVSVDGKGKSLVSRLGKPFFIKLRFLPQVAQVEHVIKAVVSVGNDIKDHVAIVLKSIHMVVEDHCSCVVLCLNFFAGLSVH